MRTVATILIPLALVASSCGGDGDSTSPSSDGAPAAVQVSAQVATPDLFAGAPQHVQIGVVATDPVEGTLLLTGGSISVTLAPAVAAEGSEVTEDASYVPAPGTPGTAADPPAFTTPDTGRGVYQLDATFPEAGVWEASISAEVSGTPITAVASFEVLAEPALPAPGQRALPTVNLTVGATDPEAVDSRAIDGAPIPDPELHAGTIRDAIRDGRPVLVLFATPTYCQSQFCGPSADALAELAATGPGDVDYLHVEIWHDFNASEVNEAAADWLLRDGDLTEPWLYLIDGEGIIVDRWAPLFDPDEVLAELEAL